MKLRDLRLRVEKLITVVEKDLNSTSRDKLMSDGRSLLESLKETKVKVPLVGDFSAGKSSLLNTFIEQDELLPTSMLAETAVSFELYYSIKERVELERMGTRVSVSDFAGIKNLNTCPGDIIKVYTTSKVIRDLEDRDIILVDMPGLDSGLEAHNKAINNYIENGTSFIVISDIEQGSLRKSTIDFLTEMKEYNLKCSVLLSKKDKKPESEAIDVKEYIQKQANSYVKANTFVGMVSAHNNELDDFKIALSKINAEELLFQKSESIVLDYEKSVIDAFLIRKSTINQSVEELDSKFRDIQSAEKKLMSELNNLEKENSIKDVNSLTSKIVGEVKNELVLKESHIVNVIMQSSENQALIGNAISTIIRPVLVNSVGEALSNINAKLSEISVGFTSSLDDFNSFNQEDFKKGMDSFTTSSKTFFTSLGDNKKIGSSTAYKTITGALGIATSIVSPWLEVAIMFAPEIIDFAKKLFGFGKDPREEIVQKYRTEIIPQVIEKIEPEIKATLIKEHKSSFVTHKQQIEAEVEKRRDAIKLKRDEEQNNKEEFSKEIAFIDAVLVELK